MTIGQVFADALVDMTSRIGTEITLERRHLLSIAICRGLSQK